MLSITPLTISTIELNKFLTTHQKFFFLLMKNVDFRRERISLRLQSIIFTIRTQLISDQITPFYYLHPGLWVL